MIKALFLDFYGTLAQEDARSYKPLRRTGLQPGEVWHIGDSFSSDVRGAAAVGIPAVWLNRRGKPAPGPCRFVPSLRVLLTELPS